jgi:iron complex outermembrane recepter protein
MFEGLGIVTGATNTPLESIVPQLIPAQPGPETLQLVVLAPPAVGPFTENATRSPVCTVAADGSIEVPGFDRGVTGVGAGTAGVFVLAGGGPSLPPPQAAKAVANAQARMRGSFIDLAMIASPPTTCWRESRSRPFFRRLKSDETAFWRDERGHRTVRVTFDVAVSRESMARRVMRSPGFTCLLAGCLSILAPAALPNEASNESLEEVIVTARLRNENLQRTPLSVVSLSGDALEAASVTHLRGLQYHVPNLTLAPSQNVGDAAANVFIRGIGQEDFIAGAESGVAIYVDGVYVARTSGMLTSLLDVDRVEVLRGPQGTLYGKNTIGGSINIVSVVPQPELQVRARLILGSFDRVEPSVVVNVPLTERLALRAAAMSVERDGYLRRVPPPGATPALVATDSQPEGDDHSRAMVLRLRWLPSDSLTVDISADASRRRSQQAASHLDELVPQASVLPIINQLITDNRLPGPRIGSQAAPDELLQSYAGNDSFIHQEGGGASMHVRQTFRAQVLELIGAHRWFSNDVATDTDGWPFSILRSRFSEDLRQYSAELRWSGQLDRSTWTAGLFALREPVDTHPTPGIGMGEVLYTCGCYFSSLPGGVSVERHLMSRSGAAYGQVTLPVAERLSATLGARVSRETKSIDGSLVALDAGLQPTSTVIATGSNRDDWSSSTYRIGLEFDASPELMFYGSAAQGFKSGGFNVRPSRALPNLGLYSFAPEKALAFELGVRSEWWQQRTRLNVTLFDTDYRDMQLRHQTLVAGQSVTLIGNAARARIRGLEAEWTILPVAGVSFGISYGHLNGRYLDVGTAPEITLSSDFQRMPAHSLAVSANYQRTLAGGTLQMHANYGRRSREQFQLRASPYDQPAYGLLGVRVGFSARNDRWSVAAFGTNLSDERYRAAGRYSGINQFGVAHSIIGMPRQLGVQVDVRL